MRGQGTDLWTQRSAFTGGNPAGAVDVNRTHWLRLGAFTLAVGAAFALAIAFFGDDPYTVRATVEDLGGWGPVAYVVLSVVLTVALFPYPPQATAAGLLFGVAEGTVYAVIGGTLGAIAAFTVARRFGRSSADQVAGPRLRRLLDEVARRGFVAVLLLGIVPGVPRQPANYLCGLTPVGFLPFIGANLVGITPYAYAYVALGGSIGDFGNTQSLVAVCALIAFAAIGLALLARERATHRPRRNL